MLIMKIGLNHRRRMAPMVHRLNAEHWLLYNLRFPPSEPSVKVFTAGSVRRWPSRPFTLAEIKRILKACGDNVEWRGLILFGLYLGQWLGDLAKLTWRAANLETSEIAFTTRKTGRRIVLPLVQPLVDYLSALPAGDNPNAFIFPNSAKHKRTASLSNLAATKAPA